MTVARLLIALLVSAAPVVAEPPAMVQALTLGSEARQAAQAGDHAATLAKLEAAVALRPDVPQLLQDLAAAQVATEHLDDAVATLGRLAALGVSAAVEKADEFAPLREHKEFKAVAKKLAANAQRQGTGETGFTLRDMTGLVEGMAWREKTGDFLFGDLHGRAIWAHGAKEARDGKPRRFTVESDDILGIAGLVVDEANTALWAAMSATPAMRGNSRETEGLAGVAEFDLETGALRRAVLLPQGTTPHALDDIALGSDGTVFTTDAGASTIWQLVPGGKALAVAVESTEFVALQGLVVVEDGRALLVADRINGLLRVDLAGRAVHRVESPPDTTLVGLHGLSVAPNGDVIAIQNGVTPKRVLRLTLGAGGESVTAVSVLESGHLTMAAASHGCVATGGEYFFIANSGAGRFGAGEPLSPRPVPIYRTKL
ncbi:MAG: hypothetical protein RIQ93_316 [Verrucomicrobiota bacterium]|jgi:hypothetical protein